MLNTFLCVFLCFFFCAFLWFLLLLITIFSSDGHLKTFLIGVALANYTHNLFSEFQQLQKTLHSTNTHTDAQWGNPLYSGPKHANWIPYNNFCSALFIRRIKTQCGQTKATANKLTNLHNVRLTHTDTHTHTHTMRHRGITKWMNEWKRSWQLFK